MNKDVILLKKVRGLKIDVGEYINYDPSIEMYKYENIQEYKKEEYTKKSKISYILSSDYIRALVDEDIAHLTDECILEESKNKEIQEEDIKGKDGILQSWNNLRSFYLSRSPLYLFL